MLPWFQYTTFHLGPIPIQVWGLFVATGILTSLAILRSRGKIEGFHVEKLIDFAFFMVVAGFVGARFFHVVFYEPHFFLEHPLEIVKIWHGGLSSIGGFVGAVATFFWYFQKKHFDQKLILKLADHLSFAALFGWIIGRIGCFMIHDHLGVHSNCPLAIRTPDGPRLEMAFMEILGLIPLVIIFIVSRKKKLPDGWYLAVLSLYYGILRFILDFYRATDIANPDARYLGLTPAQYFSILMAGWGVYMFKEIGWLGRGISRLGSK